MQNPTYLQDANTEQKRKRKKGHLSMTPDPAQIHKLS